MIQLVAENSSYQEWVEDNDVFEQLSIVHDWCDYEDYSYFDKCKTIEELIAVYAFIQFVVGTEFVFTVYELIDEEEENDDTTVADLVKKFNEQMGKEML